jgi:hypothetical protein
VRAREDVRGDLMSARHRLPKLLLRQGSSTTAVSPGPGRMICGFAHSAAARCSPCRLVWGWRSTSPTTRCWPGWRVGTGSMRRSPRSPRPASSPRW